MTIVTLTMSRNESDLIEPFLRHHSRLVDEMVIMDDSVDGTTEIIKNCAAELGNIVLLPENKKFGFYQADTMTALLRDHEDCDVVIPLDVDEFISAGYRQELEDVLSVIPSGAAGRWAWRTYVMRGTNPDPPRTMITRRTEESPPYWKVVTHGVKGGRIAPGNHYIEGNCDTFDLDIPLLHFPVRSHNQLVAKCVVGWLSVMAANSNARATGAAYQQRDAFDRIILGLESSDVEYISDTYAQTGDRPTKTIIDPFPFDYERKYSTGRFPDPIGVIAKSWERSLL